MLYKTESRMQGEREDSECEIAWGTEEGYRKRCIGQNSESWGYESYIRAKKTAKKTREEEA